MDNSHTQADTMLGPQQVTWAPASLGEEKHIWTLAFYLRLNGNRYVCFAASGSQLMGARQ